MDSKYFERQEKRALISEAKSTGIQKCKFYSKFMQFGISGKVLEKLVEDEIKKIDEEAGDMELIIT